MSSRKMLRESKTLASPQTFVTVEIHNKVEKMKFSKHRSSVLNQLKATELILNESLNKQPSVNQSHFAPKRRISGSEKSFRVTKPSGFKTQNSKTTLTSAIESVKQVEKNYKMSPEINLKLRQLANITGQFERACEKKKKSKKYVCQTQKSYRLPAVEERQLSVGPQKENNQQQKRKRNWKQKLKRGKVLIERIKDNPAFYNKLREATFRQKQKQVKQKSHKESFQSIHDKFIAPLANERKSAPTNMISTGFYNSFCAPNIQPSTYYDRKVELEPINSLQQFATGGDSLPFKESSTHVNVSEFVRNKERMNFLKHIYNFTKDKCGNIKDMNCTNFNEPNLLSLVYYLQNQSNMTTGQRKTMRKRLNFVD